MNFRGWGNVALVGLLAACAQQPGQPNAWDPAAHRAATGVAIDDQWCGYMRDLRAHLDGVGERPSEDMRDAALAAVRDEAATAKDGDPLWPFRKALICEFIEGAGEERQEFDWVSNAEFLSNALMAFGNPPPADGISPLVPVFDHLDGAEPESLEPVDLTQPAYCEALETSELALSQQRGGVVGAVGFPGSLQRAPDWFAHVQVSYHRWAREQLEGHQLEEGPVDFGGIPYHCKRFHNALEGSKEFAVKDNLIFLLPELDDPNTAGRLEVQDSEGNVIVLDRVLAAAQLDNGGTGGEAIDFFAEDLAASPALAGAVDRSNNLPPPKVFQVLFGYNERDPVADDPGLISLVAELKTRDPAEPLRIAMTGHADCVGPRWYNQLISEDRVQNVFGQVIRPTLLGQGFGENELDDSKRFKLVGLGETVPARAPGDRCEASDPDRRVVVVVQ
ncbi:MAG: hypothetical protein AAF367_11325 [Pseudomonadota bacterium]